MPEHYPDVSAPRRHQGLPRRLRRTRSGCWSTSSSRNGVTHARRVDGRRLGHRGPGGYEPPLRPAGRRERPPLGPAAPRLPRHLHRGDHPLPPLHRPAHAAGVDRQADPGRRTGQQRRRHHRRTVVEGPARTRSRCRPGRAPGSCRSTSRAGRATRSGGRHRTSRCRGSARRFRCSRPVMGVNPTLYGLPEPNHKLFEAHPTQSVELPLRLGSGDVIPKPNVARLDGETVHFDDGTSDDFDVIIYATGYNITFPFFDPGLHQRTGQPDPALQADVQARHRRPGLHRLRAGGADAVPVRRVPVAAARRLRHRAATRCRRPPRWSAPSTRTTQRYIGHCTESARHTQQVDYFHYEHDIRTRELAAGMRNAAAARRGLVRA